MVLLAPAVRRGARRRRCRARGPRRSSGPRRSARARSSRRCARPGARVAAADDGERGARERARRGPPRRAARGGSAISSRAARIGFVGQRDDRVAGRARPIRGCARPPRAPRTESSAASASADANAASSQRFLWRMACGRPNCCSISRRLAAPSPGVSVSCSQLASPGSCVMPPCYGVAYHIERADGLVTCMTSA